MSNIVEKLEKRNDVESKIILKEIEDKIKETKKDAIVLCPECGSPELGTLDMGMVVYCTRCKEKDIQPFLYKAEKETE